VGIVAVSTDTELIKATEELAQYLDQHPVATGINVGNSFFLVAEEWRRRSPRTPEEIAQYYREAKAYLWQLVFANYGIEGQVKIREFAKTAFAPSSSVLDLGGGIGSTLLSLSQTTKTHADVGGVMFDYAAWRYRRSGMNVEMVSLPDGYLLNGGPLADRLFDAIVCTEVIEHVPDPESVVKLISQVLRPGGQAIATVSFDDENGLFPMHLHVGELTNHEFVSTVFPKYGLVLQPGPVPLFVKE
jgi:ubiquinone/menaquinone biosynthesis C-methylase UbiE